VKVIASDDDGSADLTLANKFVHGNPELRSLAVTKPADPRRKSLEVNSLLSQFNPAAEACVFREEFEDQFVGGIDVLWIARECYPAKRSFAFAEEWADVFGHEAGNVVGVLDSNQLGLSADVIAVVKGYGSTALQLQHRLHLLAHRSHRAARVLFG